MSLVDGHVLRREREEASSHPHHAQANHLEALEVDDFRPETNRHRTEPDNDDDGTHSSRRSTAED
eukprot:scaffold157629_cov25-Prasinocladus_malaysianus.AAC.1